MGKTNTTKELEEQIWKRTTKRGTFGCFEVTMGWYGKERVDYMTYDTKGVWRCYEIKVSKPDFFSKAKVTFVGNYNYYVMTEELFNQVEEHIPPHIGVYISDGKVVSCIKNPKKQQISIEEQVLKNSIIRSLHRENDKSLKLKNNTSVKNLNKKLKTSENTVKKEKNKNKELISFLDNKYGKGWDK